ncbi:Serine/threonine-protein phosphatase 2B catalytic subunit alpha [Perkinsus olseni]|uniref:Serine/threonine-protein phosphatase 2B catalytic subunit alpha n=1 Tax=Perkinsus olseni TaxID=32597 RepID=A0A7J6MWK0_PEROL|nr:Serine/threonine-protein phosphatase 2B catalytic subunit alpha [Perkinsus olseni]
MLSFTLSWLLLCSHYGGWSVVLFLLSLMSEGKRKVKVEIKYARDLYDTEMFGKMDPYVKVRLGRGKKYKTDVKKDVGRNPTFYESVEFKYDDEPEISFEVWDKDTFSSDDFVGSARVSMASIAKHGHWEGDLVLYRDGANKAGTLNVAIRMASTPSSKTATPTPTVVAHATAVPVASHHQQQQPSQPIMATVVTNTSSYGNAQPVVATAMPATAATAATAYTQGGGGGAPAVVNATVISTAPPGSNAGRGPMIQGRVIGGASVPPPQPSVGYNSGNFATSNYQAPPGPDGQPLVQVQSGGQQQQYYSPPFSAGPPSAPPGAPGYSSANFVTSNYQSPPGPDGQPAVYVQPGQHSSVGAYPHY